MEKVNPSIQEAIDRIVLREHEEREPSGRLSAGKLGWPLQWQMLHHMRIQPKSFDEFTLRKFQRGKDVENRIIEWLKPEKKQVECEYRGVVGYCDMVLEYPVEIKSVTNMAFRYIQKEGGKASHKLQGELYAKALGFPKYAIGYVASDDYRVLCYEYEVKDEVDSVITAYEDQVKKGFVPIFEAKEKWQGMLEYNSYPEWMKLTEKEIAEKLGALRLAN